MRAYYYDADGYFWASFDPEYPFQIGDYQYTYVAPDDEAMQWTGSQWEWTPTALVRIAYKAYRTTYLENFSWAGRSIPGECNALSFPHYLAAAMEPPESERTVFFQTNYFMEDDSEVMTAQEVIDMIHAFWLKRQKAADIYTSIKNDIEASPPLITIGSEVISALDSYSTSYVPREKCPPMQAIYAIVSP